MEVGGKRVDLKNISMPLLNFYGKYDHLVPPAACELLTSKVGSRDTEDVCLDTGHIGIYVSSKCQKEFAPKIAVWLKERDTDHDRRRTKTAAAAKAGSGGAAAKNKPSTRQRKGTRRSQPRGETV